MPLPVITNVWRVTLNWNRMNGVMPRNVMHIGGDWSASTDADVGSAIAAAAVTDMFGSIQTDFFLNDVDILRLDGTSAARVQSVGGIPATGGSGDFSPASSLVLTLHTAQRGVRGRGRMFLGPAAESDITDGKWNGSTTRTDILTAWDAFGLALFTSPGAFTLGVASYKHADFHAVDNFTINQVLGTQRRRQDQLR